jgi:hypothetical protein
LTQSVACTPARSKPGDCAGLSALWWCQLPDDPVMYPNEAPRTTFFAWAVPHDAGLPLKLSGSPSSAVPAATHDDAKLQLTAVNLPPDPKAEPSVISFADDAPQLDGRAERCARFVIGGFFDFV